MLWRDETVERAYGILSFVRCLLSAHANMQTCATSPQQTNMNFSPCHSALCIIYLHFSVQFSLVAISSRAHNSCHELPAHLTAHEFWTVTGVLPLPRFVFLWVVLTHSDSFFQDLYNVVFIISHSQIPFHELCITLIDKKFSALFPDHIEYVSLACRKNGRCFRFTETVGRMGWPLS